MEVTLIGLFNADIGNQMVIDSHFWHCCIFLPFPPCFQVVNDGSFYPTRPLLRHSVFRGNGSELLQGRNYLTDDGIRSAYAVVTGKLDGILTSNVTEFGSDIQAVILVRQEATIIYDIGDIVCR